MTKIRRSQLNGTIRSLHCNTSFVVRVTDASAVDVFRISRILSYHVHVPLSATRWFLFLFRKRLTTDRVLIGSSVGSIVFIKLWSVRIRGCVFGTISRRVRNVLPCRRGSVSRAYTVNAVRDCFTREKKLKNTSIIIVLRVQCSRFGRQRSPRPRRAQRPAYKNRYVFPVTYASALSLADALNYIFFFSMTALLLAGNQRSPDVLGESHRKRTRFLVRREITFIISIPPS